MVVVGTVLTTLPFCADAGFYSGNDLKEKLEVNSTATGGYAGGVGLGYVIGVLDVYDGFGTCPDKVQAGQVAQVVLKYLRENPEKLHLSADTLTLAAIGKAWPCPERKPSTQAAPSAGARQPGKAKPKAQDSPF